jgi:hypothetical protein
MLAGPLEPSCFGCAPGVLASQLLRGSQVQGDYLGARGLGELSSRL